MSDTIVILPVIVPLCGAAAALLLRNHHRAQAAWSLGVILAALAASAAALAAVWKSGQPIVFQMGAWAAPFGITLVGDMLSTTMAVMCQFVMAAGILYSLGCKDQCARYPAFYPLFLMLAAGLTGGMLTGDLFNLFVFVELVVISGTILTAISDDRYGTEAAYKYFYISLLSSVFLLLAVGALYVSYGTLNMADLAQRIAGQPDAPLLPAAIALLLATFMIKSAVFPFHFWQPDFHTAAPTPVSAMLSSVVVKLGVYGFIRMTTLWFAPQADAIRSLLVALGMVGVVFGGLSALGTHNAKRMLAYSTLAQIGFILVGIGWGTPLSLAAAVVFMINHSLTKAAMLMLAGSVASRAPVKSASFAVVAGVGKTMPFAGLLFFLGGMALAGLPPTNGFISKLSLFASGVQAAQFLPLVVIGLASILTLMYTTRAFMRIWMQPREGDGAGGGGKLKAHGDRLFAPALLIAACLALGVWAEPLVQVSQAAAAWVADPTAYIQAVLK